MTRRKRTRMRKRWNRARRLGCIMPPWITVPMPFALAWMRGRYVTETLAYGHRLPAFW